MVVDPLTPFTMLCRSRGCLMDLCSVRRQSAPAWNNDPGSVKGACPFLTPYGQVVIASGD